MRETTMELSLTVAEAYDCLLVKEDGVVHSYVKGFPGHFFGAALTDERVRELLSRAKDRNSLFLVEEGILDHNIKAWDEKTEEWIYLECREGKTTNAEGERA